MQDSCMVLARIMQENAKSLVISIQVELLLINQFISQLIKVNINKTIYYEIELRSIYKTVGSVYSLQNEPVYMTILICTDSQEYVKTFVFEKSRDVSYMESL